MGVQDNEKVKEVMKKYKMDGEPLYPYTETLFFSKALWVIASIAIFYFNFQMWGDATLNTHFRSFVAGVLALKIYGSIEDFIELGEEIGIIIPENSGEEE